MITPIFAIAPLLAGVLMLQVPPIDQVDPFVSANISAMSHQSLNVTGIQVETSFYSTQEPVITHGIIELENSDEQKTDQVTIRKVTCYAGEEAIAIDSLFVYQLPDYEEIDPTKIDQPPLTTTQYEISFPGISAMPYLNQDIQVEVELEINGETVLVRSPYTISLRTKKR